MNVPSLPSDLVSRPNWVLHNNKEPFQPDSKRASSTDPKTWSDFETVKKYADVYDGIGFVITPPLVGIDFDKVRDPETGRIEPWAVQWIERLNSYTELSPSGCGFHVWVQSDWRGGRKIGQIESYSRDRYFTVTGQQVPGSPSTINTVKAELIDEMLAFAERRKNPPAKTQHIDESESGEDNKIVRELVKELNTGDADKIERELAKRYPQQRER